MIIIRAKGLSEQLEKIQTKMNKTQKFLDKEGIVKQIVLPIINVLDRNNGFKIIREQQCKNGIIDILLTNKSRAKVVIEAKIADQDLENPAIKNQLFDYLKCTDAKLGVLTNGYDWGFYLPRYKDHWRMKKFHELNMKNTSLKQLHNQFINLLHFDKILSPSYSPTARRKISQFDIDDSLMGIHDNEIIKKINTIRSKFPTLSSEEKKCLLDLEIEACDRDLPPEYCDWSFTVNLDNR